MVPLTITLFSESRRAVRDERRFLAYAAKDVAGVHLAARLTTCLRRSRLASATALWQLARGSGTSTPAKNSGGSAKLVSMGLKRGLAKTGPLRRAGFLLLMSHT